MRSVTEEPSANQSSLARGADTVVVERDPSHYRVHSRDGVITSALDLDPAEHVATMSFHVASGRRSRAASGPVVSAVLDLAADAGCRTVRATLPLGEIDLIDRLSDVLEDVRTRAAGATCLLDATVRSAPRATT